MDHSVGQILSKVDETNLDKKTLIIFLSDNGGPIRDWTSSNLPLRNGTGSMFEGGLRVPFMMCWPSKIQAGQTFDRPICSLDIFPAAAMIAGAAIPKNIDGLDMML